MSNFKEGVVATIIGLLASTGCSHIKKFENALEKAGIMSYEVSLTSSCIAVGRVGYGATFVGYTKEPRKVAGTMCCVDEENWVCNMDLKVNK